MFFIVVDGCILFIKNVRFVNLNKNITAVTAIRRTTNAENIILHAVGVIQWVG